MSQRPRLRLQEVMELPPEEAVRKTRRKTRRRSERVPPKEIEKTTQTEKKLITKADRYAFQRLVELRA